jgi:hypothetical protein
VPIPLLLWCMYNQTEVMYFQIAVYALTKTGYLLQLPIDILERQAGVIPKMKRLVEKFFIILINNY